MTENQNESRYKLSADWLLRGSLSRLGDKLDDILGRKPATPSSLATSQLIERLKRLLDSEVKEIDGKGKVVPHDLKLKIQWDKFSNGEDDSLDRLQTELLAAAADHINDRLYYTFAPLELHVASDYFTDGVKLQASFGKFGDVAGEQELNVTMPNLQITEIKLGDEPAISHKGLLAAIDPLGKNLIKRVVIPDDGRISIGRAGGNHLVIDDNSISKIHASLSISADDKLAVADTGSTNGTFINDQRISYGTAWGFSNDDKVKFGSVEVEFRVDETAEVSNIEHRVKPDDKTVEISGLEFKTRETVEETQADTEISGSGEQARD